ncbi:hypothetical protein PIB30_053779 [Stylosanthes scabra]|uniref:Uncharacterized protein n=1 Tax=Stylosanthes scabra TaxID=79078 RepID=A0ABU6VKB1_9FABA|nr:hypothetical protein [Stylosanthes scabra]
MNAKWHMQESLKEGDRELLKERFNYVGELHGKILFFNSHSNWKCVASDGWARGDSFLALVHHNGKTKKRTAEGVKFKCDCPTNVFIFGGTSLADLQASIERRLGLEARKRVSHIFYRVAVAVVSSGVKYDCFSVESDEDLQVLFHCWQQFPEVRTTELYVEIVDLGASLGGSNPHPQQST